MDTSFIPHEDIIEEKYMSRFFQVLTASIDRTRMAVSVIFLSVVDIRDQKEEDITVFLENKIRQSDVLCHFEAPFQWGLILSQSGEEEACAFLNRLFSDMSLQDDLSFSASIVEIGNSDAAFDKVVEKGRESLKLALQTGPGHIEYVKDFKKKSLVHLKLSILEENDILRNVIQTSLEDLKIDGFQLEIRTFQDGYDFLNSDWYLSSHPHVLIMNDILPRKNGLEVLHTVRHLPNNKKFIVFMMTQRNSEEDMVYAYESGVDQYLVKPFSLRLFEAQIKRVFERFWS
ncbi:response regulator transcription factor [Bacillus norwichensis]|uniref:Response regulator n=1 Tax=Bacillus norwichensis TaxID=2762217 RepID=A0ABR8VKS0_9BACI|nr:response regulator [Bacillus norwichensis]MBD8005345.1 response regulator [Bacillus norwichensis]